MAGQLGEQTSLGEGRGMKGANPVDRLFILAQVQSIEITANEVLHLLDHLADVRQMVLLCLERHHLRGLLLKGSINEYLACQRAVLLRLSDGRRPNREKELN